MTLTRLRTGLRAGLALLLGVPMAFYGALHVVALSKDGFSVHDALGSLPLLLGLTLLAFAIALPWRHRGEGSWKSRLVAVPAVLVGALFVLLPMCMGLYETHKWRGDVGSAPSAAYRDVTFEASDGVKLSGWYRPSAQRRDGDRRPRRRQRPPRQRRAREPARPPRLRRAALRRPRARPQRGPPERLGLGLEATTSRARSRS